jgi:hypothetical protein
MGAWKRRKEKAHPHVLVAPPAVGAAVLAGTCAVLLRQVGFHSTNISVATIICSEHFTFSSSKAFGAVLSTSYSY